MASDAAERNIFSVAIPRKRKSLVNLAYSFQNPFRAL